MQLALKTDPPPVRQDAHGVLRVADTRVTLDSLVDLYDQGASAEEIALSFEALDLHEVYAALGYYLAHRRGSTNICGCNAKPAPWHASRRSGGARRQPCAPARRATAVA